MEEVPTKRERESEEDANERQAKELRESDEVRTMEVVYSMMSPEERRQMGARQFSRMPKDWQKAIARTSPGVLMILARTSKMFAELAREETTWQYFFQRDFPREWKFCKGQLPFFVMRPGHPFYRESDEFVPAEDATAWKRFYLNTAYEYRKFCQEFQDVYAWEIRRKGNVPMINLQFASAAQIQEWVHRVPLSMRFLTFDYRSSLAWKFVQLLTVFIAGPDISLRGNNDVCLAYAQYALADRDRYWLLPYLMYSHPFGLSSDEDDFQILVNHDQDQPLQLEAEYGENVWGVESDLSEMVGVDIARDWRNWIKDPNRPPFPSSPGVALFSETDERRLQTLINSRDVELLPGLTILDEDEIMDKEDSFWRGWSVLQHCYENPCLYSLPSLVRWESYTQNAFMIDNADTVQLFCENLIEGDPSRLIFPTMHAQRFFKLHDDESRFQDCATPFIIVRERRIQNVSNFQVRRLFRKYSKNPRVKKDDGFPIIHLESCIQCGSIPQISYQCGGTCNSAIYCNRECQRAHWLAGHSRECQKK